MDKEEVLQEIGLTKNEAKVYSTLLFLGPSTAGKIAEKCKLHRTNVYDALERLLKKGLVSFVNTGKKGEIKTFEAADPNHLMTILDQKKSQLQSIIPSLILDKQLAKRTTAHIYEGLDAFKRVFFNLLNYNEEIIAYGIPKCVPEIVKPFIENFHRQRREKKIMMRHLYNEDARERINYLNSMPYTEAKYLPEKYNSYVSTIICGDQILLVSWLSKPLTFVCIENRALADAYRKYFDLLYSQAFTEPEKATKK